MDSLKKVKNHPMFANHDLQSQISLAEEYTNTAKIKEKFSHLLDIDVAEESIREREQCKFNHSDEVNRNRDAMKLDTAIALRLPIKLFLSKLNRPTPAIVRSLTSWLKFTYGPLHAGLIVGDISIEWDDSSLVVPMPASPDTPRDFIGHCDPEGQWNQKIGAAVRDMSLANRENMDTPIKLDILHRNIKEKEILIDNLTDVILKYNRSKKYNVLFCNCQHFVKEALNALGIHRHPTFDDNTKLNEYLEGLKRGKSATLTFDSHLKLDQHVIENGGSLDIAEKEYLICMYFQFHLTELRELSLLDQEGWKCPIETCQCDQLESNISKESLYFYRFRATKEASLHISVPPRVEAIAEEVNTDIDEENADDGDQTSLHEHLDRGESIDGQKNLLTRYAGYSSRVLTKLRNHPDFRELTVTEQERKCEVLSEKESFRQEYFSQYIDITSQSIVLEACKDQSNPECRSASEQQRRSGDRFEKIFDVQVNLILRSPDCNAKSKIFPVQSALQVGDYAYEWNETSLVVPIELEKLTSRPHLLSPVLEQTKWSDMLEKERDNVQQAISHNDYSMEIKLHYDLTQKKDQLLHAFMSTIIKFNRDHTYNRWRCNNQTFLTQAMKSLGIKKPQLSNSIGKYIGQFKPTKKISRKISSHEELDAFVGEVLELQFLKKDIEYLIAKYFLFHVSDWEEEPESESKGSSDNDNWKCSVLECKLPELERTLKELTSISSPCT